MTRTSSCSVGLLERRARKKIKKGEKRAPKKTALFLFDKKRALEKKIIKRAAEGRNKKNVLQKKKKAKIKNDFFFLFEKKGRTQKKIALQ